MTPSTRPPATKRQKVVAAVVLTVAAGWGIALASSWNSEPPDAVLCEYQGSAARYADCLQAGN